MRDGESGVKHPSGQSRDPHQSDEGLGEDSAVGAAGLACQSCGAGHRSVCLGPSVKFALHHGWSVCEAFGLAFSPASGRLVLLKVHICYCA